MKFIMNIVQQMINDNQNSNTIPTKKNSQLNEYQSIKKSMQARQEQSQIVDKIREDEQFREQISVYSSKKSASQKGQRQQISPELNMKNSKKQLITGFLPVHQQQYTPDQMERHHQIITNLWEYRYWRYVQYAIKTKDWLKVFAFIGQWKIKCLQLSKMMVETNFSAKQIDTNDHRYQYKQKGEIGIYLIDGIIIRAAKQFKKKGRIDKQAVKNLHQQFLGGNVLNNLLLSLRSEFPDFPIFKVPLQCLQKYLGYTFLFQADTLCQGIQTLMNGPMNITYQYNEQIQPILSIIGKMLNLKPFKIIYDNKIIEIPFCLTIEVHKIRSTFNDFSIAEWINPNSILYPQNQKDNILRTPQFYLLNFAKLWPLFIDSNIVRSSGYLRPEATISWKKSLSNVIFSNVSFEKDEIGQLELAEASKHVKEESIKSITKLLDQATFFAVDSPTIQQLLHQKGINMRFLGQIASRFSLGYNRKIFEIQMVAKILKKIFFITITDFQSQNNLKDLFIDFLNLVFIQSKQGEIFWVNTVYNKVNEYYEYEMKEYPPTFQGGGLLHAITYHFGIKMKIIDYPFFKNSETIFNAAHVIGISGLSKSYDLQTCQLKKACEKYKEKKKQGVYTEAIDALNLLVSMISLSDPEDTYSVTSNPQSFFYSELAQCYRDIEKFDMAVKYAQLALKGIPDKHADAIKPYCVLVRCYSQRKEMNRCLQYYEKSLTNLNYHLATNHPLTISVYNTLGFEFLASNDPSKCEKIFVKSFEICEQALGYMHMNSGKILLQLADLPLSPEKTINFLLQALTILQNIESDKQKVRIVCMKISEIYAKIGNITKMIHFARKSDHWRMQIIGLQKLNQYKSVLQLCNRIPSSTQELSFLISKSFSSYIKLINYVPSNNLYKLFISLKEDLPERQESLERVYKLLISSGNLSTTTVDFVKGALTNLITNIPELLQESDFFVGLNFLLEYKNSKMKNALSAYMDILVIVGVASAEKIFSQFRKTF